MKIKKQNVNELIFSILVSLYCILPQNYYVIGPVSIINFTAMVLIMWYILSIKKIKLIHLRSNNLFFWVFIVVQMIMFFATAGVFSGIANFITYFMVCYIFINTVNDKDLLLKVIDIIIFTGMIMGLIGIFESVTKTYIFQGSLFSVKESIRYGVLRATVTFGHPINLGLFLGIVAILIFYRLNINCQVNKRKYYLFCYIIVSISMILTVSRLAICFYLIAQSIILIQLGIGKFFKYFFIFIISCSIFMIISLYIGFDVNKLLNDFIDTISSTLGLSLVSSSTIGIGNRFDLYKWVIDDVRGNEIWGLGVGVTFKYKMSEWFTKTSIEVHYLYTYFKTGLIGLITLLLSYLGNLYFINKDRKNKCMNFEKKISLTSVLMAIFISYYISIFGVQETDTVRIYNILVCIGICYVRIRKEKVKGLQTNV